MSLRIAWVTELDSTSKSKDKTNHLKLNSPFKKPKACKAETQPAAALAFQVCIPLAVQSSTGSVPAPGTTAVGLVTNACDSQVSPLCRNTSQ